MIAMYNLKGGVGKTTTAVNVAFSASLQRTPTLIWDLDPQAAASFYFEKKTKKSYGGKHVLSGLKSIIRRTNYPCLDIIPGSFDNRKIDSLFQSKNELKKLLKPLKKDYEFIVIDAPPTHGPLATQLFRSVDAIIIPILPTPLSINALETLFKWLNKTGIDVPCYPFFSMVDRRKRMHRDIASQYRLERPEILETIIPYASNIEKMGFAKKPFGAMAPNSELQKLYDRLTEEIRERISK